jgi:hypothetical protein
MDGVSKGHLNLAGSSNILSLTPPRYVPFIVRGTALAVWYDRQEDQYLVLCPECHELITCDTLGILYHEMVWNEKMCCQGCRAKTCFERDPRLIGVFLDFWYRTRNSPASPSWLEAIPQQQSNL